MVPAGQVWGGNPCTFVRDLSKEEMNANYMASYSKGAAENAASDSFSLWPRDFTNDSVPAGEDSMADYAEKKYFSNLKH